MVDHMKVGGGIIKDLGVAALASGIVLFLSSAANYWNGAVLLVVGFVAVIVGDWLKGKK